MDDPAEKVIGKKIELEMSESIAQISDALAKAQAALSNPKKTSKNPFRKSKYANLAACMDAARVPLTENKLAVVQLPFFEGGAVGVRTLLSHASGDWISSTLKLKPTKTDPQGVGSAITYARRYAFCAMVGLAQEDDDASSHVTAEEKTDPEPQQTEFLDLPTKKTRPLGRKN